MSGVVYKVWAPGREQPTGYVRAASEADAIDKALLLEARDGFFDENAEEWMTLQAERVPELDAVLSLRALQDWGKCAVHCAACGEAVNQYRGGPIAFCCEECENKYQRDQVDYCAKEEDAIFLYVDV